jgi:hypothetical protein
VNPADHQGGESVRVSQVQRDVDRDALVVSEVPHPVAGVDRDQQRAAPAEHATKLG